MALNITQNYVLSGQRSPYDSDYESGRELLKQPIASDLLPHYDGGTSIAIKYGLDLLVRDNAEANRHLKAAETSALSPADEQTHDDARAFREAMREC